MLRRLLNIASIVCLVLCVALMGLWVRSYWRADTVLVSSPSQTFLVGSGLDVDLNAADVGFAVPYWCLVLLSGSIAAIPWIRRRCRFTLRVLFVAAALVAVALGLIAWLDRAWIGKRRKPQALLLRNGSRFRISQEFLGVRPSRRASERNGRGGTDADHSCHWAGGQSVAIPLLHFKFGSQLNEIPAVLQAGVEFRDK